MLYRIPETPSPERVREYVELWYSTQSYIEADRALRLLFVELCQSNNSMSHILLKASALNDFYSTNIYKTYAVAEHIYELDIDERLRDGDLKLVEDIADTKVSEGKTRYFYSFASKYCSHHQPDKYAIYDSYVDEMLRYFRRTDGFAKFKNEELRQYDRFMEIIAQFREHYHLDAGEFSRRDIDRYLWQLGKECKRIPDKKQDNGV